MAGGFVAVPVVPTFRGMSKEFAERLEKPARQAGQRAGKSITEGIGSSVENLERQVKASSSKLESLDRAYEKSAANQAAQKERVEAATLKLQDAEEKYQAVLADGGKGTAELAKVKTAKAQLIGATEKLEQAEHETRVAEQKHADQLEDLQSTLSRYDQAQDDLADQLGVTRQELQKMGGDFSDLDAQIDDSTQKAEGWGSRFAGMLKPLGKLGGIAVGLAGVNSIAGTLQAGFEKVTSIEDTTASLEILMGSAEDAKDVMAQLEESNQQTPYSFDAWAGAGKNLIAFGVEADKVAGIVTGLGEAASASGKGEEALNSMASAFGKAAASGKISMETINSLSEGGVQGLTILANEFGVTTEEMQKMISSGKVSAEEGIDILTKGIREGSEGMAGEVASMSGVMGKMAETTSGRLTNMKAAFNNAAKSVLEELNPLIGAAAEKITDWTYAGIDLFKTYMMPAIQEGVEAAQRVFEKITPALELTRDVLKTVVEWLVDSAKWLVKNKDWVSALAVSVGVLVGAYKAWAAYQKIIAAGGFLKFIAQAVKSTKLWAAAQRVLNTVINANPIARVITVIAALAAGLVWFFTKTETGQKLWEQFTQALGEGWQWVVDKVTAGWEWLRDNVFAPLVGFLVEDVLPVVHSAWESLKDGWETMSAGIQWAWENIIQPVFSAIGQAAMFLLGVVGTIVLAPLLILWNTLSEGIQWAWENVIKPAWDALTKFATETLWPMLQQVFQLIKDAFQAVGDGIMWVWDNVIKPTWDAIAAAAQWLWDNVLMFVFDSIKNGFQALGDSIRWVYDNVIKPVWDLFASTMQWLWDNIVMFYVNLIKDAWNGLGTAFRWVYDNVIKPTWDAFGNALRGLWDNVVNPVVSWISNKWDWLKNSMHESWVWIKTQVFDSFRNGERVKLFVCGAGFIGICRSGRGRPRPFD